MPGDDTRADALARWEAGTWQSIATIPDDEPVLVYIPADQFGGQPGQCGWMGQAAPGEWIRQHATLWRPLLKVPVVTV